jgi:hypothetical protein
MRPVDKWYKQIKTAEEKLQKIRKTCAHKKWHVGWYSWRIGSMTPQRICNRCDAIVPGITDIEAKPYLDSLQASPTQTGQAGSSFTLTI